MTCTVRFSSKKKRRGQKQIIGKAVKQSERRGEQEVRGGRVMCAMAIGVRLVKRAALPFSKYNAKYGAGMMTPVATPVL